MPEKLVSAEQLREVFGEIPELRQPVNFPNPDGIIDQLPFKVFKLSEKAGSEKACLETELFPGSAHIPNSQALVRVIYEQPYGLRAKKWMHLQRIGEGEDEQTFLDRGQISYDLGEVEIVLDMYQDSPFAPFQSDLEEPSKFKVAISVLSTADPRERHPLAQTAYDLNSLINIHTQFAYAEYEDARKGLVEKPLQSKWDPPTTLSAYQHTYFQWEYLVGAKVGHTEYKNRDDGRSDTFFNRWLTRINSIGLVQLGDTPYWQKMSHTSSEHAYSDTGRLRFSRVNKDTKESWMLSVPEQIANYSKSTLVNNFQHTSLMDLFYNYPVGFCIKRPGEKSKWFTTFGRVDTRRPLRISS